MSCSMKMWNNFPHTVEMELPVACPFGSNEVLQKGRLSDILRPELPSSALTCSLVEELGNGLA